MRDELLRKDFREKRSAQSFGANLTLADTSNNSGNTKVKVVCSCRLIVVMCRFHSATETENNNGCAAARPPHSGARARPGFYIPMLRVVFKHVGKRFCIQRGAVVGEGTSRVGPARGISE